MSIIPGLVKIKQAVVRCDEGKPGSSWWQDDGRGVAWLSLRDTGISQGLVGTGERFQTLVIQNKKLNRYKLRGSRQEQFRSSMTNTIQSIQVFMSHFEGCFESLA